MPTLESDVLRSAMCQTDCPGVAVCEFGGWLSISVDEELFDGATKKIIRRGRCEPFLAYEKQRHIEQTFDSSGIPVRFKDCSFDSFNTSKSASSYPLEMAKLSVISACENGESIVLAGNPGAGKTHLAVAITKRVIEKGKNAIFAPYVSLISDLKSSFSGTSEVSTHEMRRLLKNTDCLVLDDVGQELLTNYSSEFLFELVNDRYNSCKQLVITTNCLSSESLTEKIDKVADNKRGKFIVRRLMDMGKWILV